MMPLHNRSIKQLAREEGISEATLFAWRKQARDRGRLLPDSDNGPDGWSARDKFSAVLETAACRGKLHYHVLYQILLLSENKKNEKWHIFRMSKVLNR